MGKQKKSQLGASRKGKGKFGGAPKRTGKKKGNKKNVKEKKVVAEMVDREQEIENFLSDEENQNLLEEDAEFAEFLGGEMDLEVKGKPRKEKKARVAEESLAENDDSDAEMVENDMQKHWEKEDRRPKHGKSAHITFDLPKLADPLKDAASSVNRKRRIQHQREVIAKLCEIIMANADNSEVFQAVQMLQKICDDEEFLIQKLAILSMTQVWKDILPDYQIRDRSSEDDNAVGPDGKPKKVQLSKAVLEKRAFESGIVQNYRNFVATLEEKMESTLQEIKKLSREGAAKKEEYAEMELVLTRAVVTLLSAKPNFNFRANLLQLCVPRLVSPNRQVAHEVSECFSNVFQSEISGELTLEIVRRIGRLLKNMEYENMPADTIDCFLSLEIHKDVEIHPFATKEEKKAYREKIGLLSIKERKMTKAERALRKEFEESEARYSKYELQRNHTAILDSVFATYFRILKKAPHSVLMPTVLRGIARHAMQINIDFLSEIISSIEELMNDSLDDSDESFNKANHTLCFSCAHAVLMILKQQPGTTAESDLGQFFTGVYRALMECVFESSEMGCTTKVGKDPLTNVIECLSLLLLEQKQIPLDRVAAFTKRIASLFLLAMPPHIAVGAMWIIANIIKRYPGIMNMIVGEQGVGATGQYMPELDEPDHCNAWATSLWELSFIQVNEHYHEEFAKVVKGFLSGGKNHPLLSSRTAEELCAVTRRDALWSGILPKDHIQPSVVRIALPKARKLHPVKPTGVMGALRKTRNAARKQEPLFNKYFTEQRTFALASRLQRHKIRMMSAKNVFTRLQARK